MQAWQLICVALAGVVAGGVNAIAGAGSLLSYPVLVGFGLAPVPANVTNDIGVCAGNVTGLFGVRHHLAGQRALLRRLVPRAALGSVLGALLLLLAPASAFAWAAPPLLLIASLITLAQPALIARTSQMRSGRHVFHGAIDAVAVYGGYFGTGIGLMFMAALGLFIDDKPQRLNAVKAVLQLLANGVAGVIFAFTAQVHWDAAGCMALGSLLGGRLGAAVANRVSAGALRTVVAVIGLGASAWLFYRQISP
ncbi:MAG: sulfite exporter TauE/SafE family protein [Solirubrobacterales bacterium]|nr:sulfite exporter TauE/SafE family protein [Solirubrobacterales bacterium]